MVQLSHPYMTSGKTKALTIQTFAGKVTFLLFNQLSRFFIAFLPRSKCLLISWLQSLSAVILELKKIKSVPASTSFPYIWHEMMGPDATILVSLMLSFKPAFFHSLPFPLSSYLLSNGQYLEPSYVFLFYSFGNVLKKQEFFSESVACF